MKVKDGADYSGARTTGDAVETSLDGSFSISNVKAGDYYLAIDKEGYELPLAQFTSKDLADPSEAMKKRLRATIHSVHVGADQTTQEELVMQRGAAVSGTATYDDGSPAGELSVILLVKDADGKWVPGLQSRYRNRFGAIQTDDYGRFRITGLPAGEYALESDLSLNEYSTTVTTDPGHPDQQTTMRMMRTKFELPLFSGNVWRKTQAVAFSLASSEERSGLDLQFPLSKLHKVQGQLVTKEGHAANGGKLSLLYADDKSQVTEADVDHKLRSFQLDFVPEGDFLLQASGVKDVVLEQIANPPGSVPRFHEEPKTVTTYGDAEQTLKVIADLSDIILTVGPASTEKSGRK